MSDESKTHWALTRRAVWIGIFFVGPLALPLLWLSPRFSLAAKIGVSLFVAATTFLMFYFAGALMDRLGKQLQDLKDLGVDFP